MLPIAHDCAMKRTNIYKQGYIVRIQSMKTVKYSLNYLILICVCIAMAKVYYGYYINGAVT